MKKTIQERLVSKLKSNNFGCLEFTGCKDKFGYGKLNISGNKFERAHRLSWILFKGEISDNLCVLHKCDNPACCNIEHLFLGTKKDNNLDKAKKDRGNHKVSIETAKLIKLDNGLLKSIAEKFNVSIGLVSMIKNNKLKEYV